MTKTTIILIGAFLASTCIAWNAFADTQTVSGASNTVTQNSNNGNNSGIINSGTGSGSNITNTATGGAGGAGGYASQHQNQHQSQGQSQTSRNDNSNDGNSQTNSFSDKRQAPAIAAPSLTSGIDTCLGSVSGGLSFVGTGGTLGTTTVDENCVRLKNSARAAQMGFSKNALYLMCLNADFRAGQRLERTPCPQDAEQRSEKLGALSPAAKGTEFPTDKKRFE